MATGAVLRVATRCSVVGLLVLGLIAPAQGGTRPSRLVFEGGEGQILVAQLDRPDLAQLSTFQPGGFGLRPSWSPEARRVVYATWPCTDALCASTTGQVVSVDLRTRASKVLVSLPAVFTDNATWSRDGRRIAFDTVTPGPFGQGTIGRTMVVNADGTGLRTVAAGLAPSWSPDSRRLALTDYASGSLVVVDVDTGCSRQVSPDGVYTGPIGIVKNYAIQPTPPTWSRDGRWLAFSGVRSATHAVVDDDPADWHAWVVRGDGSRARQLRDAGHVLRAPSWSPDGSRVVFDDAAGITVASIDGRQARRIVATRAAADHTGTYVGLSSWSPHGSLIAYEHDVIGPDVFWQTLRVVRPDGRGARVVSQLDDGVFAPLRWAPDSPA
jgi:Tol biopolymer transport system component